MSELLAPAWAALFAPFAEFAFMRRALVATLALSLSAAPLGVFLTLRRMSLLGDALSHAILPGVAIGFMPWRWVACWRACWWWVFRQR